MPGTLYSAAKYSRGEGSPSARRTAESAPSAPMRCRQRIGRPATVTVRAGEVDGRRRANRRGPRRRPAGSTRAAAVPGRAGRWCEPRSRRRRAPPRGPRRTPRAPRWRRAAPGGSPSGSSSRIVLSVRPPAQVLGPTSGALLQHQHLAPRLGQDLRRPEARRAGADDQVLNVFHASSSGSARRPRARSAVRRVGGEPPLARAGSGPGDRHRRRRGRPAGWWCGEGGRSGRAAPARHSDAT